ncbi:MAG TPA: hypothetical protein EYQ81_00105 [Sneathiellales bacterium]|nr:hypothetical protein [Sneathiellales bacterium]
MGTKLIGAAAFVYTALTSFGVEFSPVAAADAPSLYEALSHTPVRAVGNEIDMSICRDRQSQICCRHHYQLHPPGEG